MINEKAAIMKRDSWLHLKEHLFHPGFLFDIFMGIAGLFFTPWILDQTDVVKGGEKSSSLGILLLCGLLAEFIGMHMVIPVICSNGSKFPLGRILPVFLWIIHFTINLTMIHPVLYPAMGWNFQAAWQDQSMPEKAIAVFMVAKEMYIAVFLLFSIWIFRKKPFQNRIVESLGLVLLTGAAFLIYTVVFDSIGYNELFKGADPQHIDSLLYRMFRITAAFLIFYFTIRMFLFLEEFSSIATKTDRIISICGIAFATTLCTYGFYAGPKVNIADLNYRDPLGRTLLVANIEYGPKKYLQNLIAAGIDINSSDNNGVAALHKAVQYGRTWTVHLLLDHGADVNLATYDGETPLFYIFSNSQATIDLQLEILEMLIKAGADPNVTVKNSLGSNSKFFVPIYLQPAVSKILAKYAKK